MGVVDYCLLHGLKVSGPDHPAILCVEESVTYGALVDRVSQFAAGLRAGGVVPGDRVALLLHDTPDFVAMHLAVMAAGAVTVAISTRSSPDDLAQTLALVGPSAIVADADFGELAFNAMSISAPAARLFWRDRELKAWKA